MDPPRGDEIAELEKAVLELAIAQAEALNAIAGALASFERGAAATLGNGLIGEPLPSERVNTAARRTVEVAMRIMRS